MDKFFQSKKTKTLMNFITLACSAVAFIMFVSQGASFSEPLVWLMLVVVITSFISLVASMPLK